MNGTALDPVVDATLQAARHILATATSPAQIKDLRDYLEEWERALRMRGDAGEQEYDAAEIKLRAERRLGDLLASVDFDKGGRPAKTNNTRLSVRLADLGVTPMQSSRWQLEASVPEREFVEWIDNMKARDEEITGAGLRRLAADLKAHGAGLADGDEFPDADTSCPSTCPTCGGAL
jgi:hypothetical protein